MKVRYTYTNVDRTSLNFLLGDYQRLVLFLESVFDTNTGLFTCLVDIEDDTAFELEMLSNTGELPTEKEIL